jgi:hypothetical protein
MNRNLIFNDLDKANEFNNFFAMQTDLDDSEAVLPELSLPENQLCDIKIGVTLVFFQSLGSTPIDNDKLKIYIKDILVDEPPLLEVAG